MSRNDVYEYDHEELIGQRYRVEGRAKGGYGVIYFCWDTIDHQAVVLKTPRVPHDPDQSRAFKQELALWAQLGRHPNVVCLHGSLELANEFYLITDWISGPLLWLDEFADWREDTLPEILQQVADKVDEWIAHNPKLKKALGEWFQEFMADAEAAIPSLEHIDQELYEDFRAWFFTVEEEFVSKTAAKIKEWDSLYGKSSQVLRDWLASGTPLPPEEVLTIGIDLCRGMSHVQDMKPGMVHRDLKPENIYMQHLGSRGFVALVGDFGSSYIAAEASLAETSLAGPPGYLAPEQLSKQPATVQSDIYAVGCILYELATGRRVFYEADDQNVKAVTIIERHRNAPYPEITRLAGWDVENLNNILRCCLEKNPADRYAHFIELCNDLVVLYQSMFKADPRTLLSETELQAQTWLGRGMTMLRLKRYEEGIEAFTKSIDVQATADAYAGRGYCQAHLGIFDVAEEDFAQAIDHDPGSFAVHYLWGQVLLKQKKYALAIGKFGVSIVQNAQYAPSYLGRGSAYYFQKKNVQAKKDLRKAWDLGLHLPIIRQMLASMGDFGDIDQFMRPPQRRAHNDDCEALIKAGLAHVDKQEYDLAIAKFTQAIHCAPNNIQAYMERGLVLKGVHRPDDAIRDYEKVLTLESNHAEALFEIGVAYAMKNELQRAQAYYEKSIALDPDGNKLVYYNLGNLHERQGHVDAAVANYEQAIRIDPVYVKPYFNAGVVLWNVEQFARAYPFLEKAADLGHPQAQMIRDSVPKPVPTPRTRPQAEDAEESEKLDIIRGSSFWLSILGGVAVHAAIGSVWLSVYTVCVSYLFLMTALVGIRIRKWSPSQTLQRLTPLLVSIVSLLLSYQLLAGWLLSVLLAVFFGFLAHLAVFASFMET